MTAQLKLDLISAVYHEVGDVEQPTAKALDVMADRLIAMTARADKAVAENVELRRRVEWLEQIASRA